MVRQCGWDRLVVLGLVNPDAGTICRVSLGLTLVQTWVRCGVVVLTLNPKKKKERCCMTMYRDHYTCSCDAEVGDLALARAAHLLGPSRVRALVGAVQRGERLRCNDEERYALGRVAETLPCPSARMATAVLALEYWQS